jgi:NADH-quinone oxidoreductase subunit N
MKWSLMQLELGVLVLALGVLLLDLWVPAENRRKLGFVAAIGVGLILISSLYRSPFFMTFQQGPGLTFHLPEFAFGQSFVLDDMAIFFKRFFLLATVIVLVMSAEFAGRIQSGLSEFYSLILFALVGMMFAASANDFPMLFVSIELITVTFYILTSFQRHRLQSLEAGIKYLILGALASSFLVFGIALLYGSTGAMGFGELAAAATTGGLAGKPVFLLGWMLLLAGLAFKIAAFPLHIWAPDVYQGAPAPVTAFLAVGSKAAGFALLLRVLFTAVPSELLTHWRGLLMAMSAITILYGSLCAIPQRNLKRLLGYSSIANAGYLLLGLAVLSHAGKAAVLYYLGGYLFTVLGAFTVICVVLRASDAEDLSVLAGLHQRSPLLAATLTLAMVSLGGVPPLAGFFGKFLLLKAAIEQGPAYYWLVAVAIIGVVISLYYYFGVIRAIYWGGEATDLSPLPVSPATRLALAACVAGMLYLGVYPSPVLRLTDQVLATWK